MPREVMKWAFPSMKVATTEAGLETGVAVECQVNSAVLTPVPTSQTIPSTGCAPATNSPGATGWQLDITWLQDWTKGDESVSLSRFAWLHDTEQVWVQLIPNPADANPFTMTGPFFAVSGGLGGTFGDGSAAQTQATWPAVDKPEISDYVAALAAAEPVVDELELEPT